MRGPAKTVWINYPSWVRIPPLPLPLVSGFHRQPRSRAGTIYSLDEVGRNAFQDRIMVITGGC